MRCGGIAMELLGVVKRCISLCARRGFYSVMLTSLVAMTAASALAAGQEEIVCIQCHAKLPGKLGEPVRLWQGSIHAQNGIACNSCHGGDPKDAANAMSPARGFLGAPKENDIPAFCGRCHAGVMKNYLASDHGWALGRGGPTCVTCHSNHLVVKASLDLINEKLCGTCHTFERAKQIKDAMSETEGLIVAIDTRITSFKRQGVDTDTLEKGLFAQRNRFHVLFHNVDAEEIRDESAGIITELRKLEGVLQGVDEVRKKRRIAGRIAVGGALFAALLLYLFRKTYD
jgi:hypothetical protein